MTTLDLNMTHKHTNALASSLSPLQPVFDHGHSDQCNYGTPSYCLDYLVAAAEGLMVHGR